MRISEDEEMEEYSYDFNDSEYRMRDIVFNIMLSGVTSITGIAMELNRQGIWGKEWRAAAVSPSCSPEITLTYFMIKIAIQGAKLNTVISSLKFAKYLWTLFRVASSSNPNIFSCIQQIIPLNKNTAIAVNT